MRIPVKTMARAAIFVGAGFIAGCMSSMTMHMPAETTPQRATDQLEIVAPVMEATIPKDAFSPEMWKDVQYCVAQGRLHTGERFGLAGCALGMQNAQTEVLVDPHSYTVLELNRTEQTRPAAQQAELRLGDKGRNRTLVMYGSMGMMKVRELRLREPPIAVESAAPGPGHMPPPPFSATVRHIYPRHDGWGIRTLRFVGSPDLPWSQQGGLAFLPSSPDVADIESKGMSWVFRRDRQSVWTAIMDVVCQYDGVLGFSESENTRIVLCHRSSKVLGTDDELLAIAAVRKADQLTVVYCAPIGEDGRAIEVAAGDATPDIRSNGVPVDVGAANYLQSVDNAAKKVYSLAEGAIKKKSKDTKGKKAPPMKENRAASQAICIHRFYQEIALQLFAPAAWKQKLSSPETVTTAGETLERLRGKLDKPPKLDPMYVFMAQADGGNFGCSVLTSSVQLVAPEVEAILADVIKRLGESYRGLVADAALLPNVRVYLVASPDVQAFATADGRVFICAGLLDTIENQGELAAVLGHELAHIVYRDVAGQMAKKAETEATIRTIMFVAQVATSLAGSLLGPAMGAGSAAAGSASAAPQMTQQLIMSTSQGLLWGLGSAALQVHAAIAVEGFSEDAELRADTFAVTCLASAGYNPEYMSAMLHTLQEKADKAKQDGGAQIRAHSALVNAKPGIDKRLKHVESLLKTR